MEYIPNYPIAAYRIDDEIATNEEFRKFVNVSYTGSLILHIFDGPLIFQNAIRHPDAHRLDMKNFINRPIPRLLRYELLLKEILSETPPYHDDRDAIPPVIEQIKSLGKETEPGVVTSKKKVELWKYNNNLEFKHGEFVVRVSVSAMTKDIHRCVIGHGSSSRKQVSGAYWQVASPAR